MRARYTVVPATDRQVIRTLPWRTLALTPLTLPGVGAVFGGGGITGAVGVTAVEGLDGIEVPMLLVAVTVTV